MKTITVYETKDGRRFDTSIEADQHEKVCNMVKMAHQALPGYEFIKNDPGTGYLRHDHESIVRFRNLTMEALCLVSPEWANMFRLNHRGIINRILDDARSPLKSLLERLKRIDLSTGREYGQEYYFDHPRECASREITPPENEAYQAAMKEGSR